MRPQLAIHKSMARKHDEFRKSRPLLGPRASECHRHPAISSWPSARARASTTTSSVFCTAKASHDFTSTSSAVSMSTSIGICSFETICWNAVAHLWSIYRVDDCYPNNQFYPPNKIVLEDPELQGILVVIGASTKAAGKRSATACVGLLVSLGNSPCRSGWWTR
ncbi:hypothetical protein MPLDJ20_130006 [Mesorhizobium plurifarium]|uniref:Uncharacterized protein n=1 Tax=Mesorhizobium plurifarium TaxID=69974 RepID=A0A090ENS9_MESPL|nr:hypothetical protein MPLDJ20_130006 [Mesorhizobium plurifarium]